jgi:hypothetical protein
MTTFSSLAVTATLLLAHPGVANVGAAILGRNRPETLCLVEEEGLLNRRCPEGMQAKGYLMQVAEPRGRGDSNNAASSSICGAGGSVGPVVANGDWLLQEGMYEYGRAGNAAGAMPRGRDALGTKFPDSAKRFDLLLGGDSLVKSSVKDFGSLTFDAYVSEPGQWTVYLYLVNSAITDLEASPDVYADCILAYTPRDPVIGEWQKLTIEPDTQGSQFFHESQQGCVDNKLAGFGEEWVLYSGLKGASCPVGASFGVVAGENKEAYIDNVILKTIPDDTVLVYDFESS